MADKDDKDDLALLDAAIAMVNAQLAEGVVMAESRGPLERELASLVEMRNKAAPTSK